MASTMLENVCQLAIRKEASDIYLTVGSRPMLNVNGRLQAITTSDITHELSHQLLKDSLSGNEQALRDLDGPEGQADYSYRQRDKDKSTDKAPVFRSFRVNACRESKGLAMVMRLVPYQAPTPEEIMLPPILTKLARQGEGLILITGPTGSGKSTTLGSLITDLTLNVGVALSTVEDPIEYYIPTRREVPSSVIQREVPTHVDSMAKTLRAILRQRPDVVMVSELRDVDTIETALSAAMSGHIVFSTFHAKSPVHCIERMIGYFPANRQEQIRTQLATSILGISTQILVRALGERGKVMACDLLVKHPSLEDMILEGESAKIRELIKQHEGENGDMLTRDTHLLELVKNEYVDLREAEKRCRNPEQFLTRLRGLS